MSTLKNHLSPLQIFALCAVFFSALYAGSAHADAADTKEDLTFSAQGVGPVTFNSTESQLRAALPAKDIKRSVGGNGMNGYECAITLFPETDKELVIVWQEPDLSAQLDTINMEAYGQYYRDVIAKVQKVCDAAPEFKKPIRMEIHGKKWASKEGLYIEMDLNALEAVNQAPIYVNTGSTESDEGMSMSFNGGKLEAITNSGVFLTLLPRPEDDVIAQIDKDVLCRKSFSSEECTQSSQNLHFTELTAECKKKLGPQSCSAHSNQLSETTKKQIHLYSIQLCTPGHCVF